jgi:Asp-tRNA(Asn)/Glu-tRNA(Gln) amidotransferase A subunit family amidase
MVVSWSLDKLGPICRSAEDDAIVYYYLKGTDGKDYGSVDHAFNYHSRQDIKKLRIAYADNYFKRLPKDAMEWAVLKTLKNMGLNVRPVSFPDSGVYTFRMADLILAVESAAAFDELTRTGRDSLLELQHRGAWPNNFRATAVHSRSGIH